MQESQNVIKKYSTPLIIGGVLLGGYIVYRLFRKKADTSEQAVSKDKKYFIKQGQSYNYPLSTYVAFADSIYNAFHLNTNIFNSVDERKIISIMKKMYNDLDVLQLIESFGRRRSPIVFLSLLVANVTLPEFLNEGLDINEINIINNMLAEKNIEIRF